MTSTDELLAAVCPAVGAAGAGFYFAPETLAAGKELGLDGSRFYFLGRGGVLGDVEPPVVVSAFGFFEPGVVARVWNSARALVAPRDAGRAYLECAHEMGRARLGGVPDLDAYADASDAVIAATDPSGLTLFAGLLGEPVPTDAAGRAMHATVVLRELRGSVHLLAVRASGLSPKVAHYLRRPQDFSRFGWKEEDTPHVGDDDRRRLADADALTDALLAPSFAVLDETGADALVAGARAIADALGVGPPATA